MPRNLTASKPATHAPERRMDLLRSLFQTKIVPGEHLLESNHYGGDVPALAARGHRLKDSQAWHY